MRSSLWLGPLSALVTICLVAGTASATDFSTDPNPPGGDPNGAPPPPPPMPPLGTPGSAAPPPVAGSTEAQLAQADAEDNGVGMHLFYLQPELGLGVAHIPSNLTVLDTGSPSGLALGLGAGLELISFQVGGRFRGITTQHYNLWSVGGELAYQPGSGRFWPRVGLSVGYAWANGWNSLICGQACDLLDVSGLDIGMRAGFQYFVTSSMEVGLDGGLDALFLKRRGISGNPTFGADDSGMGYSAVAMAHVGFHF
jgi:hypothetical protein